MKFGTLPPEVPVQRSLDLLAPAFAARVRAVLADAALAGGRGEWPFETLRTDDRQKYLFGFGRDYDDGRGKVTNAASALNSWHGFGLAIDVVEKSADPWGAPVMFWNALGACAEQHGLVWGGRWHHADLPHLQFSACPVSPTDDDRALFASGGCAAVWAKYGADVIDTDSLLVSTT